MEENGSRFDGYVRVPPSSLKSIELRHLISEKDPSIAVLDAGDASTTITGFTEWVGSWNGEAISLGWDWGVVHCIVVLINPNEIRTNIQLVSRDLRPEPAARARAYLMDWIASIPWQELAIHDLLRNDGALRK